MKVGINFDGVTIEVEASPSDHVGTVIKRALASIFAPELSPPADACSVRLCEEDVSHRDRLEDLLELEEGHMLHVTLPF